MNIVTIKKAEMTYEMWFTFIALSFAYSRQLFLWKKKKSYNPTKRSLTGRGQQLANEHRRYNLSYIFELMVDQWKMLLRIFWTYRDSCLEIF